MRWDPLLLHSRYKHINLGWQMKMNTPNLKRSSASIHCCFANFFYTEIAIHIVRGVDTFCRTSKCIETQFGPLKKKKKTLLITITILNASVNLITMYISTVCTTNSNISSAYWIFWRHWAHFVAFSLGTRFISHLCLFGVLLTSPQRKARAGEGIEVEGFGDFCAVAVLWTWKSAPDHTLNGNNLDFIPLCAMMCDK